MRSSGLIKGSQSLTNMLGPKRTPLAGRDKKGYPSPSGADVCHACWAEWGAAMTVAEYHAIGQDDGETASYEPSPHDPPAGEGGGAADSDGTHEY